MRQLQPGESTGYGRRFVAERPTWIGIVPVGYADGFRRDLTGTEVRVAGEPRRVVGTISMDAFSVELDRELPVGTPVTLLGHGVQAEAHARVAGTIGYELVTGINRGARADTVWDRRQLIPPEGILDEWRLADAQRLELPIEGMTCAGVRGPGREDAEQAGRRRGDRELRHRARDRRLRARPSLRASWSRRSRRPATGRCCPASRLEPGTPDAGASPRSSPPR